MTLIITRYFEDAAQARSARSELVNYERLSPRILTLFDRPTGLAEALAAAKVDAKAIKAYEKRMGDGGAVLLVRAGYKPLGVAQTFRNITAEMGAADVGKVTEEVYIKEDPTRRVSVLTDHRHMLSRPIHSANPNPHMADWPISLISRRKPFTYTVVPPHGRMASWPIGLLLPGSIRYGRFPFDLLVPGHKFMAKFPFAHLIPGHKFQANFPFGHIVPGHKFMANFPFGHLIPGHKFQAKFPFGHLVPGHRRMANWPFPLLLNGKKHTNSLVPGHKYQAKFPFAHLIPGHKFQAKFPFGHIVPGHKFMANFPFA
ncbi:MAG: PucR family transcriptional regulator, partial [Paracoccaceae bacterium]|nr:PucR family transcriptional regulator [Paracoccaceae bacterium]